MARAGDELRSGVVLVGGRSSRLGTPKALLELAGAPLLRHVLHAVAPAVDEIVLVAAPEASQAAELRRGLAHEVELLVHAWPGPARAPHAPAPPADAASHAATRARVVHDAEPHLGPVSGLATGLAAARGALAWVTACDVPFLAPGLVAGLFARAVAAPEVDVVVPRWRGYLEPLLAVYRPATMAAHFARQLADGVLKPTARFAERRVAVVDEDEVLRLDPSGRSFANLNEPADVAAARALVERERDALTAPADRPGRSPRGSSAGG